MRVETLYFFRLLPTVLSLVLFVLIFFRKGMCPRTAFLAASVLWGTAVLVVTEALSAVHALNALYLTSAWLIILLAAVIAYTRAAGRRPVNSTLVPALQVSLFQASLIAGLALIVLVTFAIAVTAAPNNVDSMAYHMSRVMHWAQNQSVAHYPTNILWQLEHSPWAEFAITHGFILSGTDFLANTVQWYAMAGSIVGVSLIAGLLGCSVQGQLFAAVFSATIPMGILQSTSTQNDYVLSFWLVCFVCFGLLARSRAGFPYAAGLGASLGLAVLTKPTAYVYAFPFLLWFLITLKAPDMRGRVWRIALVGLIALLFNGGHYYRNYQAFGSVLNAGEYRYTNETIGPGVAVSNIARNLALHLGTPSESLNKVIGSAFVELHRVIGMNPSDPKTTFLDSQFSINMMTNNEDSAGNPVHLVLIVGTLFFLTARRAWRKNVLVMLYGAAMLSGFLLFCLLLKWQPWHSRLHLPLFVLWSPVVAWMLEAINLPRLAEPLVVGLLLLSIPWLLFNGMRPAVSFWGHPSIFTSDRTSQYFTGKPWLEQSYLAAAGQIRAGGCRDVGLRTEGEDFEYPLWPVLREYCSPMPRMEHVAVHNRSAKIGLRNFLPAAEVAMREKGLEFVPASHGAGK